jgi:hypothetical protein
MKKSSSTPLRAGETCWPVFGPIPAGTAMPSRAWRAVKPLVIALSLAVVALPPSIARDETVELTAAQTRNLGVEAINAKRYAATLEIADTLLERDSKDRVAQVLRARALLGLNRPREAISPAGVAWDLSEKDDEYYIAAMSMAQALALNGNHTRAQLWLRRAAQSAPSKSTKQAAIEGYKAVRDRNPLSFNLSASVAPSSNVNNGSTATMLGRFTLQGASLALSGVEASLGVETHYKLQSSKTQETELFVSAFGQTYELSRDAKALAPAAKGSDYAYGTVEIGLGHQRRAGEAGLNFAATLGKNWYGGLPLSDYLRLDSGVQWLLGPKTRAGLSLQSETQKRLDGPNRDALVLGATGSVTQILGNRDSLRFSANLRNTQSDATWIDHRAMTLRVAYARAEPFYGVGLTGGVNFETRDYDISAFSASGRQDRKLGLSVTAAFNKIDYMGFVPSLELTAARNDSNISIYQRREFGLALGIKSAF